ncbi:MAG: ABC transporter ATP-binding protein [Cohaesibacteraceae bacterium]|nr:ABC transporter ATP-binding protein [Cohaesibacteraceae bacterium]MBL4877141.1 ABC transporter ATP-binding protein [Cohaesibacteraceae bacterium]
MNQRSTKTLPAPALSVQHLSVEYATDSGPAEALKDICFTIESNQRVGLVGESGCGKSTLLKAIMGVVATNGTVKSGQIRLKDTDLLSLDENSRRKTRWRDISMITQSALNALNPVHRVGDQIMEVIRAHQPVSRNEARTRVQELFTLVGVDPGRTGDYPHQFSGGMRQRVVIAMALALEPQIILADEPTTALDVIVQDQIFTRIRELQEKLSFALILVTHDLSLVAENCTHMIVMYAGVIVEMGPTREIIKNPRHPYSIGLRNAVPVPGSNRDPISIPGSPPDLTHHQPGCLFSARCPLADDICHRTSPPVRQGKENRMVRCHKDGETVLFAQKAFRQSAWKLS